MLTIRGWVKKVKKGPFCSNRLFIFFPKSGDNLNLRKVMRYVSGTEAVSRIFFTPSDLKARMAVRNIRRTITE